MSTWLAVLVSSVAAYALKLVGYLLPASWLEHPRAARIGGLLPAALLAALVVVQAFTSGAHLVLDARAVGVAVAVVALLLRAPFLVVVVVAALAAALTRAAGWG